MFESCETVIIETENGPVTINKSDFDKDKHKLKSDKVQEKAQVSKKKATKKAK